MKKVQMPPPCLKFLNSVVLKVENGKATVRYEPSAEMTNPFGLIQGGILAAMLDNVMGPAGFSAAEGKAFSTIQMSLTYQGAVKPGEIVIGEANVVKKGKTLMLVDGELFREHDRKLLARATAVNMFLNPE